MKNIGVLSLLVVATLLFAIAFPAMAAGPKPPAPPVPAAPAFATAPADEEHPHIREALKAMRDAKGHLEAAAHDFQGHRSKSLEHLNAAIHEAEVCLTVK